ncbi:unnamed protein product [Ectocarpus sp. 4 AP-2014]
MFERGTRTTKKRFQTSDADFTALSPQEAASFTSGDPYVYALTAGYATYARTALESVTTPVTHPRGETGFVGSCTGRDSISAACPAKRMTSPQRPKRLVRTSSTTSLSCTTRRPPCRPTSSCTGYKDPRLPHPTSRLRTRGQAVSGSTCSSKRTNGQGRNKRGDEGRSRLAKVDGVTEPVVHRSTVICLSSEYRKALPHGIQYRGNNGDEKDSRFEGAKSEIKRPVVGPIVQCRGPSFSRLVGTRRPAHTHPRLRAWRQ